MWGVVFAAATVGLLVFGAGALQAQPVVSDGVPDSCASLSGRTVWRVAGDCTSVVIKANGKAWKVRLPGFHTEQGGFWLRSMLALPSERLLVTHNYAGAFVLDQNGRVRARYKGGRFPAVMFDGAAIHKDREPQPQEPAGLYAQLIAASTSGAGVLVRFDGDASAVAVLTTALKPVCLVRLQNGTFVQAVPDATGWTITGTVDSSLPVRFHLSATGRLALVPRPRSVSAQQKPTTGYAPVNGLKMYYEIHGKGEPVVLLHGAFMTITNNWDGWIGELAKTRRVIAVEMQGHGRTADVPRDFTYENLADDVAALLDHLKIPQADLIGYSMGGAVAMECAIRHPDKVRKAVLISSTFRSDGMLPEGQAAISKLTADVFKGSPLETEYKKLSPTPDGFPKLVQRLVAMFTKGYDFGANKLKATPAPMFFIFGDADGVRLEHIAEMFRLKGGETLGDMGPRSASRLAILPDTTHVTLMQRMSIIVPMINDFLDAKP